MEKQNIKKEIRLKDLPPHLRAKYKNSILFQKQNQLKSTKFEFDIKKLRQRKAEKEKTIQEKLEQFKLNSTQENYLEKVFKKLSAKHNYQYFDSQDISDVLKKMNFKITSNEIDLMIWQFDQNLNKRISQKQFFNMYKKCTMDKSGAQPKNLFHLTQFMMYCSKPDHYLITVEDTLQLLYVRAKKQAQINKLDQKMLLEEEIKVIFGNQEKTPQGVEKQIGFKEYLQKINQRAIEKRKEQIIKKKAQFKY